MNIIEASEKAIDRRKKLETVRVAALEMVSHWRELPEQTRRQAYSMEDYFRFEYLDAALRELEKG